MLNRPLVVTGPDVTGEALLAITLATVLADVTTYTTLLSAGTYGEARRDHAAAALLDAYLDADAEDDDPFDADEDFGEHWSLWRPHARQRTVDCLGTLAPGAFTELQRPDTGWGFDYEPTPFVPLEDRVTLEVALLKAGCHVRDCPRLVELYQDPPEDWRTLVSRPWDR